MKIIEITQGLHLPITNEESDVLGRFQSGQEIARREFNDRETFIANQLVNKNVLLRKNQNGEILYKKR
jgi:hypothetical protein